MLLLQAVTLQPKLPGMVSMVAKVGNTVVDAKEGAVLSQEGHSGPFADRVNLCGSFETMQHISFVGGFANFYCHDCMLSQPSQQVPAGCVCVCVLTGHSPPTQILCKL